MNLKISFIHYNLTADLPGIIKIRFQLKLRFSDIFIYG
jgi:hypothetical protein